LKTRAKIKTVIVVRNKAGKIKYYKEQPATPISWLKTVYYSIKNKLRRE